MTAPLDPFEHRLDLAARALPREIAPPPELLSRVQDAIAARQVRALPTSLTAPARAVFRRGLAAAAILFVGVLIGAGGMLLRARTPEERVAAGGAPVDGSASAAAARFASYDRAADDLTRLLDARRATLRPETIAVIDRSVQQIDDALADVRAALARDPASSALTDAARRLYDQKLDLLKRATALSAS